MPSNLQAVILCSLINSEKYGREIRNDVEQRIGKKLPLGSLYTTLSRMENAGFIDSRMGESTHTRGGYKRKYFWLTGYGQQALSKYQMYITNALDGVCLNVRYT